MRECRRWRNDRLFAAVAVIVTAAVFIGVGLVIDTSRSPAVATAAPPGTAAIVPVTPARVLDTREPIGIATVGPVGPDGVVELDVLGRGGVPSTGVGGVVLNVTIVTPTAPTFITVWPTGQPMPTASSLNALPGEVFANLVVAKVGDGGAVSLYNYAGEAHLVADVTGWIPSSSELTTITPARLLDTRDGTGGHLGPVGEDAAIELDVTGVGGVPDSDVNSVLLNVTVTEPTAPSYITTWPTGEPMPTASSLNMIAGQTIPNLVLAKVGTGGKVSLYNRFGTTHLVADVVGYTTATASPTIVALTPARVLDTRDGTGAPARAVTDDTTIDLDVVGVGGVPDTGVTGVLLNVTVTEPTAPSFVTTWPNGLPRPLASSLNMVAGQTIPNLVLAPVGAGGKVSLYNYAGNTHLVADVVGYLRAPAGTTAPEIADETTAITSEQIVSIDGDPDDDQTVTITLAPGTEVEVGSVLVAGPSSEAPSGLLRRITAVTTRPDGTLVATAVRARLTDAVPAGSFDVTAPLSAATGRLTQAQPVGTTAFDDTLECKAEVKISASVDGSIDPSIDLMFDWDLGGVNAARMVAGLDIAVDLQAAAAAAVTCTATRQLFIVTFAPLVVPIGGFPVVFVPELGMDLTLSGSIEGSLSGTADYDLQLTAGIVYDEATGIDTIAAVTPTATSTWAANAKAAAGIELLPALRLATYGIVGPEAAVPFGVSVDLEPCRTPLWRLTSSIKAKVGLSLSKWFGGFEIATSEFTLTESVIAEGGEPIADFPGCENEVEIISYNLGARMRAEADRDSYFYDAEGQEIGSSSEVAFRERHERINGYSNEHPTATPGLFQSTYENDDPDDDAATVTTQIGPYVVANRAVAVNAQASIAGASASASSSTSISFGEAGDDHTIGIELASSTAATADSDVDTDTEETDYYAGAHAENRARVDFVLSGSRTFSFAPCGGDFRAQLSRVDGVVTLLGNGDCLATQELEAGYYFLILTSEAESHDDDGPTEYAPSVSIDATITLTK